MTKLKAVRYESGRKREWDHFVKESKNGIFLFYRDYVEYHADRFPDSSLIFLDEDEKLVAVMPATIIGNNVLSSHAGLTFGGVVSGTSMKIGVMLDVFGALNAYSREHGFTKLLYKAVPHIYHQLPAEEDLYVLFLQGARLCRRDVSVAIEMQERLPFSKGRKWSLKQAEKFGLNVSRSFDFATFMAIEEQLLETKYGARPVHTAAEIALLATRFPDNIKLFTTCGGGTMQAGVIIYESRHVAHAQYIGTSSEGRKTGALDLIIEYLINDYYAAKPYFDFGISTEDGGRYLNTGLVENKQSYGARAIVHDFYELEIPSDKKP